MDKLRIAVYACLALMVAAVAADIAVVTVGTQEAEAFSFSFSDGNLTAVGLNIANAQPGDRLMLFGLPDPSGCGLATLDSPDGPVEVDGNVHFYVRPSAHTFALLTGPPAEGGASYHGKEDYGAGTCAFGLMAGVPVPAAAAERATDSLHIHPGHGLDIVYIVRASFNEPEVYAALAASLNAAAPAWESLNANAGTVQRGYVQDADNVLRPLALLSGLAALAGIVLLAVRRRRSAKPDGPAAAGTEAALDLAAAGEVHLTRLRNAWVLVGLLLAAALIGLTLLVATITSGLSNLEEPRGGWSDQILQLTFAVDVGALTAWGVAFNRLRRELRAWRDAWARLRSDPDLS